MTTCVIILVEDDDHERETLQELLSDGGLAVRSYASAESLLAAGPLPGRCILVTDYRLGGMSGEQLIMRLRDRYHGPIVVRSSERAADVEAGVLAAGADLFLSKREPTEKLLKVIRGIRDRLPASH